MSLLDRMRHVWTTFNEKDENAFIIDEKSEEQIKLIKPGIYFYNSILIKFI